MLAGRDSLIRLIGKRKRTLSPHLSLLLSQQQTNNNNNNLEAQEEAAVVEATTSSEPEWVSCPVCGASIRGSDFIVNSHLDTCLARGTKRKMSQRTLLQLNFSPISERKTCLGVTDKPREDLRNGDVVGNKECSDPQMTVKSCSFKIDEQNHYLSDGANKCMSNSSTCVDAETQNKVKEDSNSLRMSPQSKRPSNANGAEDGSFIGRIETSIVGRKFHDDVELQEGATFSILRDPENVKDKHAIKVLSADSGCGQMLGYLPRELAKFLSPLIDKHHLRCEGYVISLPQHPLDVVPISIVCQKMVAPEHYDLQNFEFLWDNVQRITEYAKISPNMTKYQQNFHLMLDAVVNNNAHLFLADEKLFLGSFNSLGNDAQRLFIRLYTRKGVILVLYF